MSMIMVVLTVCTLLWFFGARFKDMFFLFAGYLFAMGLIWLAWVGAIYFVLVKPLVALFA